MTNIRTNRGWATAIVAATLMTLAASVPAWCQSNPVPFISQPLVPDAVPPGGGAFTLTVNGTGFVPGAVVNWNGVPLATTFATSSLLTATVPPSDIATAGTASITVANPGGIVSSPAALPVINAVSDVAFGLTTKLNAGSEPQGVAVADLNGDGKLDAVICYSGDSVVAVLLGNGDGTFQPQVEYAAGAYPAGVLAVDMNGDGKLDLVVTSGEGVSVMLGNGDGSFQSPRTVPFASYEYAMAAADFNSDGNLDIVVVAYPNLVGVFLGNGDGTVQSPIEFTVGNNVESVAAGDFDGDGKLDLAIGDREGPGGRYGAVDVVLGNGDGTFQGFVAYGTPQQTFQVAVADFNGDGKLDLAAAASSTVSILIGNGDGTFQSSVNYSVPSSLCSEVAAQDMNGDGKVDLIAVGDNAPIFLLLGNGDDTFESPNSYTVSGPYYSGAVAIGDFNGDGRLDIFTDNYDPAAAYLLLQSNSVLSPTYIDFGTVAAGRSSPPVKVTLKNTGTAPFKVGTVAFNGKGKYDFTETDNCLGTVIPAGGHCTLNISFAPPYAGEVSTTLVVRDSENQSGQIVTLQGLALP